MNRIELKMNAKDKLKGKYGDAIAVFMIFYALSYAANFVIGFIFGISIEIFNINNETIIDLIINILSSLISIIISGLFSLGMTSYYLKVSRNENVNYKELFSKTNMFGKFICTSICMGIIIIIGYLLLIIPGIIAILALSQTMYILLDNTNIKTIDAIKLSNKMMNGHKIEYLLLQLSFFGWIILGIFTCGLLYLWLIPYMYVTNANFYNKIKEEYEQKN
jgi:uncharacterized membrane protein